MKPNEISCRRCAAQPDEQCIGVTNLGARVQLIFFHAKRIEDAAAMTLPGEDIETAAFDKVVEDSGLV